MKHDEMIGKVRALAGLPDRGAAERATRAVVTTLSERLPAGLARHGAAQLPPDLAAGVRQAADAAGAGAAGERFGLTVFAGRVAGRAGTDEDTALREAAAVLEVLDAALAPELTERIAGALPADIRELLPVRRAAGNGGAQRDWRRRADGPANRRRSPRFPRFPVLSFSLVCDRRPGAVGR